MKVIAWDVDETLNNYVEVWLKWVNEELNLDLQYKEITNYDLTKFFTLDKRVVQSYIDKFKFDGHYVSLKPNCIIKDWFNRYGKYFHHVALTSPSLQTSKFSSEWVLKNFGKWIRGIHFIPSDRLDNSFIETKAEWLQRNNVDIFIEDNQNNYEQAIEKGITSFLIKKPWNNGEPLEDILDKLSRMIL